MKNRRWPGFQQKLGFLQVSADIIWLVQGLQFGDCKKGALQQLMLQTGQPLSKLQAPSHDLAYWPSVKQGQRTQGFVTAPIHANAAIAHSEPPPRHMGNMPVCLAATCLQATLCWASSRTMVSSTTTCREWLTPSATQPHSYHPEELQPCCQCLSALLPMPRSSHSPPSKN